MPCPHFSISIVKGGKGQSAVASAAYISGEKKKPDEKVNAVKQRTPVTDDSKRRVPDKDKPV